MRRPGVRDTTWSFADVPTIEGRWFRGVTRDAVPAVCFIGRLVRSSPQHIMLTLISDSISMRLNAEPMVPPGQARFVFT
jgi:hypothetical protein